MTDPAIPDFVAGVAVFVLAIPASIGALWFIFGLLVAFFNAAVTPRNKGERDDGRG